jgi:asparagine synthase (glutamine-hydrolysing)
MLYIASEVKALFAAGVPARWDHESFFHAGTGYPTRTLYDGVFQIPPGHYALATEKHFQVKCYWDFNYPPAADASLKRSAEDYIAEFRHELDEAVRIRLRADVPVGVYLSGGLDSCSVLGLVARHHPDPIRAFTLTFEHAAYDEGAIARDMALQANAEFHTIAIGQADLADAFSDAVAQSETFCVNAHGVAKYLLSKAVRDAGYKVVLTGEGADEILGGYPHFRRDMLLYNREGQDPEEIKQLLNYLEEQNTVSRGLLLPDGESGNLDHAKQVLGYLPSWFETFSTRDLKTLPLLTPEFRSQFEQREAFRALLADIDVREQLSGRDPIHQSLYLWGKTVLPGYILTVLGDRMEMGHSIEGRVPFLDHHVVECLCAQPVSMKIRGMTEKYVLREAARDVVTDTVYRRQKHPFLSPPATLTPGERFYDFVQETLRGPSLAAVPFYDQQAVITLLDRLPKMDTATRIATDQVLMTITSSCVLQERFSLA